MALVKVVANDSSYCSKFFLFQRNLKNEDSRAKKPFLEGSKKDEVKKVIKSKNDCNKS